MLRTIRVIVENGLLRPLEALNLPEGAVLEGEVSVSGVGEDGDDNPRSLEEGLRKLQDALAKHPEEWWEQFDRGIAAGRIDAPDPR